VEWGSTWRRDLKLPWRKAGPSNHLDDKADLNQQVVNKVLPLWSGGLAWLEYLVLRVSVILPYGTWCWVWVWRLGTTVSIFGS